jgi:membrane-associated phospholipid phosphatase
MERVEHNHQASKRAQAGIVACITTFLAASKVRDGWHHPIDVVFGAMVGTAVARRVCRK